MNVDTTQMNVDTTQMNVDATQMNLLDELRCTSDNLHFNMSLAQLQPQLVVVNFVVVALIVVTDH